MADGSITPLNSGSPAIQTDGPGDGWTAKAAHLMEAASPGGWVMNQLQPVMADLGRQAGLGNTSWGAGLQKALDTPGSFQSFREGFDQGVLDGAKDMVSSVATLAGKAVQYGADHTSAGDAGDALRTAAHAWLPQSAQQWLHGSSVGQALNAATPSTARGQASDEALGKMTDAVGHYFQTHTASQVADDVKGAIGKQWDSLKADHDKAAAQGPQAEARWWGQTLGRTAFEVATTIGLPESKAGDAAKVIQGGSDLAKGLEGTQDARRLVQGADRVLEHSGGGAADAARVQHTAQDAGAVDHAAGDAAAAARPAIVDGRQQVYIDQAGQKGAWNKSLNQPLQPNADYHYNGYKFSTDAQGRVSQVEGKLDLKTADRNGYQQAKAGKAGDAGDEGGHLIASIFNGPGERLNLTPMNGNFNKGAWKSLETKLADALRDGKSVDVKIDAKYGGDGVRADSFRVQYKIGDGDVETARFRNIPGGGK